MKCTYQWSYADLVKVYMTTIQPNDEYNRVPNTLFCVILDTDIDSLNER